jgi:GntR family transcriptional regulator
MKPAARTSEPLYHRLRASLRARIESGELAPGSAIPTENDLILQYRVSRTTVREAIGGLVQEGILYRRQGKGTFVASRRFAEDLGRLTGFSEEMEARGINADANLLSSEAITLGGREASLLDLPDGAKAYRTVRLRLVGGDPISVETAIFPFDIGLRVAQADQSTVGYYQLLEDQHGMKLTEAEQTIAARKATAEEAIALQLPRGAPILVVERVTFDAWDRRVMLSRAVFRPDRYSYRVRLRR